MAWVEVCYLHLSSEFGHAFFFRAVQLSLFFMKLVYMRQLPFCEEKKSIQYGTETCTFSSYWGFIPLLFSTSFEIGPTCIIIFFMTRKIIFLFLKVLFSSKHLQQFFSFEENTVPNWHILVKICHDQRLSPHHEKNSSL